MSLAVDVVRPQHATPDVNVPDRLVGTIAARLLVELAGRADSDGTVAVPLSALAAAVQTSKRQVRRSAGDLVRAGVMEIIRSAQTGGRYAPKVYRLTISYRRSAPTSASVLSRTGADPVTARPRTVI